MTVNEIETTLQSLYQRHENLSEATLLTLLKSGGWDEKMIRDAITVHRHLKSPHNEITETITALLPAVQEEPVFVPEVDIAHRLSDHYENNDKNIDMVAKTDIFAQKTEPEPAEQQSLVSPAPEPIIRNTSVEKVTEEPPHNLPLKPFEATPQIWSFARYKSIFYGDAVHQEPKKEPVEVVVVKEKKPEHDSSHMVHVRAVPLTRDDEKLVLLASAMLVAILVLLGYMYSQGRL